ncbi:hypothetical protein ACIQZI_07010 [Peribacillus sp. NPDC096379]|uniref:hypothetical protein n=1 Tax=Peribacillus sp. NPDC096379 TaxID=3364393 RepID=UPI003823F59B
MDSDQLFYQIGTDSSFLEKPIGMKSLLLAPAERLDVIIDFSNLGGKMITLKNDVPTHFPIGDPVDPDSTGIIMQFRVTKLLSNIDTSVIPAFMGSIEWPAEYTASNHRYLQLSKEKDQYGRPLFLLDQKNGTIRLLNIHMLVRLKFGISLIRTEVTTAFCHRFNLCC